MRQRAPFREIFAWCTYDFANSGYTTVILTTVFNAFFVGVVAGGRPDATFLWTLTLSLANLLVLLAGPVLGAIADYSAAKKKFLVWTTLTCVVSTAALALVGPGDVLLASTLVVVSAAAFAAGENFIAAFLPEIAPPEQMGRISGYGWAWGYFGGLTSLALCLGYLAWSGSMGVTAQEAVPFTNVLVAVLFGLAALPTFLWLKERRERSGISSGWGYVRVGFARLGTTLREARRFGELFKLLLCLGTYHCGIQAVVGVAAIFTQETLGFTAADNIRLILVLNLSAAAGAFLFGTLQDRLGSKRTIGLTLLLWIVTTLGAYFVERRRTFWLIGNLAGLAMGSSQSAGRAMIGLFSPPAKAAEFFGLWGMAVKASAVVGLLSYGWLTWATGSHRTAVLSTAAFFVVGLLLLLPIDEKKGQLVAATYQERE